MRCWGCWPNTGGVIKKKKNKKTLPLPSDQKCRNLLRQSEKLSNRKLWGYSWLFWKKLFSRHILPKGAWLLQEDCEWGRSSPMGAVWEVFLPKAAWHLHRHACTCHPDELGGGHHWFWVPTISGVCTQWGHSCLRCRGKTVQ